MTWTSAFGNACGKLLRAIVNRMALARISPNFLTFLGLVIDTLAAFLFGYANADNQGRMFFYAGLVIFGAGFFDLVDGRVARASNKVTRFGAFFDSVVDRYSDAALFFGLLVYYSRGGRFFYVVLAALAMISSVMVSYTRARAEGLGLDAKSGLLARPERVVLLAAGLLIGGQGWLLWTLLILAAASVLTSIQRIVVVRRAALRADEQADESATGAEAARTTPGVWRFEGMPSLPFFSGGRHRRTPGDSSGSSVTSGRATRR